jgi:hypothetical protein
MEHIDKIKNDVLKSKQQFFNLLEEGSRHHINEFKKQSNFYRECSYTKSGRILMSDKQVKKHFIDMLESLESNSCKITGCFLCRNCDTEMEMDTEEQDFVNNFFSSLEMLGRPIHKCMKCMNDKYIEYCKKWENEDGKTNINVYPNPNNKTIIIDLPLWKVNDLTKKENEDTTCPVDFDEGDCKGSIILGMGIHHALNKVLERNDVNKDFKVIFYLSFEKGYEDMMKICDNTKDAEDYIDKLFFKNNKDILESCDLDIESSYMEFLCEVVIKHRIKGSIKYGMNEFNTKNDNGIRIPANKPN